MKRSIIIIAGIVIILLLVGVWAYLLFFGSSTPPSVFGNLGITPPDDGNVPTEPAPEEPADDPAASETAVDDNPLTQLTTKPVVGFRYLEREGESDAVIYAEAGTGHLYEINLDTGNETRVSNTTIAGASQAVFSASGTEAVLIDGNGAAFHGSLTQDGSLELRSIPTDITNMTAVGENDVLFVSRETERSVGRQLNLATLEEAVLFTAPFTTLSVAWGNTPESTHYVYPSPAASLPGYLYRADGNGLGHTGAEDFGLTALTGDDFWAVSVNEDGTPRSYFIEKDTLEKTPAPFYLFPEKCVASSDFPDEFFCAGSLSQTPGTQPDDWYKGTTVFSDDLWLISAATGEALLIASPEAESGRAVDVNDVTLGDGETAILFTNKLDNSLWIYDL